MKLLLSFLIVWLSFSQNILGHPCDNLEIATFPTQAAGRIKPLYVLAKENVDFIFSQKPKMSPTLLFCKLSFLSHVDFPEKSELLFKVEHPDAKKFLGIEDNAKGVSLEILLGKEEELRREYFSRKLNDGLKKEYNKLLQRMQGFMSIVNGEQWTLPTMSGEKITWEPINVHLAKWKEDNFQHTEKLLIDLATNYEQQEGTKHHLEYRYFAWKPYVFALLTTLLSMILLVTLPKARWGLALSILSLLIQVVAITVRVLISGRAPITNMYETVIFSGFGALVIALFLFMVKKDKIYLLAGLAYNFLTLLMSIFANNMLSPAISPLVPVLRDNFWLSTHVTTVILSYAALAVSWMLANLVLLQKTFQFPFLKHYQENTMVPLIYNAVKIGVILLSAGVILGGVWADYSWGRFWGWDPKETWSLIVLLIYMAILHGKYTSWITPKRFVPLIAFAFLSVMMAWFGVNYILASGLHSYGFSEGGAIFLGSFFTVQILLLMNYLLKRKEC